MSPSKKRKREDEELSIDLTSRIITVVIGAEARELKVHEGLLSQRSPFFAAALSTAWREGQGARLELPEDHFEIVDLYLKHLYTNELHINWATTLGAFPLPEFDTLARLYVFGEKIGDASFKNAVIRAILRRMSTAIDGYLSNPVEDVIHIIYNGTPAGSKARQLLVDNFADRGFERWLSTDPRKSHPEFVLDLARALLRKCEGKEGVRTLEEMQDGRYEEDGNAASKA